MISEKLDCGANLLRGIVIFMSLPVEVKQAIENIINAGGEAMISCESEVFFVYDAKSSYISDMISALPRNIEPCGGSND